MKKEDVLKEVEEKSKELLNSNEELASRLRKNQETLELIGQELDSLRGERSDVFDPAFRSRLESVKEDLVEKKKVISLCPDSTRKSSACRPAKRRPST